MNNYPDYEALARIEYGRMLWRNPRTQAALLRHWTDRRHPYRDRFAKQRSLIEQILGSTASYEQLDQELGAQGASLRTVSREIPPVFGQFWRR